MYKIIEENVKIRLDGKWLNSTAILTSTSGGLQVNYVDLDGNILKKQAYCRSVYRYRHIDNQSEAKPTSYLADLFKVKDDPQDAKEEQDALFGYSKPKTNGSFSI